MESTIRKPAVSGRFYPSGKEDLITLIKDLHGAGKKPEGSLVLQNILGGIVPHAGYIYSGRHAIPFFDVLARQEVHYDTYVIVCPNHHGYGPAVALDPHARWLTPLGEVELDNDFYALSGAELSAEAHQMEHAAEVVLPLLQYFIPAGFKILPLSMRDQTPQQATRLADALRKLALKHKKQICLIASSDFSHFVSVDKGKEQDNAVIEHLLNFDTAKAFAAICTGDVSICGYGPIMTLLEYARLSAANPAIEILSRGHSGETHSMEQVVHYLSAVVYEGNA